MYNYKLNKLPKNTVEINVDIPKATIEEEYSVAFKKLQADLTIKGFRKGKVPKNLAEKHLKKEDVYQELVKSLLPKLYEEIVKKENLRPIINPKIELIKAKADEDWQIKITIAEKPAVTLLDYKELVKKIKAENKKKDIWVPGKTQQNKEPDSKKQQELLNQILASILKVSKCEIPDLILEEEVNQKLANLLTDIQKIGLTVESYLKSKNLTQEELKKRYRQEAEETYKLEFILVEIADKEGIKVEQKDLDKLFENITDKNEREKAINNSYFYASVLRKQKTLDYLMTI